MERSVSLISPHLAWPHLQWPQSIWTDRSQPREQGARPSSPWLRPIT